MLQKEIEIVNLNSLLPFVQASNSTVLALIPSQCNVFSFKATISIMQLFSNMQTFSAISYKIGMLNIYFWCYCIFSKSKGFQTLDIS